MDDKEKSFRDMVSRVIDAIKSSDTKDELEAVYTLWTGYHLALFILCDGDFPTYELCCDVRDAYREKERQLDAEEASK